MPSPSPAPNKVIKVITEILAQKVKKEKVS